MLVRQPSPWLCRCMGYALQDTQQEQQFRADLVALTPHLRSFALSICRDACQTDDLVQESLLKAWQHREQFRPGSALKSWVFTILRNSFIGERRRSWRSCPLEPEIAENTLYAVSDPIKVIELDEMRRALAALETEQREAVLLIGAGGLPYAVAAKVCGAKVGTMKSRASRGRVRLQEILDAGDYGMDGERCGDATAIIFAQVARICARGPEAC